MRVPFLLLLLCLAGASASVAVDGPVLTLPLAVAGLAAIAALVLLGIASLRRKPAPATPVPVPVRVQPSRPKRTYARRPPKSPIVIDGSNVMHWNGETPDLETLREVIAALRAEGYQPGVIFDANAGYKFRDRYLDDRHFATLLNLPGDRVLVVAKGEQADPTILAAARDLKAKVITNDRYRDWTTDFPEVQTPGHLVRGGYRDGQLWFDRQALAA